MRIWFQTNRNSLLATCCLLCSSICSAQLPTPPPAVPQGFRTPENVTTPNNAVDQNALPAYLLDPTIQPLPDAPMPNKEKPGFWTFRTWDEPPLYTNREIIHDKMWMAAHGIWLASIVYDVEVTHQALAHHKCVENDAEATPSRGELYKNDLIAFAAGTFMDYLYVKYMFKPFSLATPTLASAWHFRGGTRWLTNCW